METLNFYIRAGLDITIMFFMIFFVLRLFKGTRAMSVLYGVGSLGLLWALAVMLQLSAVSWAFSGMGETLLLILAVVFAPEIRRGLAQVGHQSIVRRFMRGDNKYIKDIVQAAEFFSKRRIGALIVFERTDDLSPYVEKGVRLNALVSTEILTTIFTAYTPLHDGAVILDDETILGAACLLPLSDKAITIERNLGTRHRAGIGISDETDAVALIVSEESGAISIAAQGGLHEVPSGQLYTMLIDMLNIDASAQNTGKDSLDHKQKGATGS